MDSLKVSKHGIHAQTHEKQNVMTPFNKVIFVIAPLLIACLYFHPDLLVKVFCEILLTVIIGTWIAIYVSHSVKNPELLQSEEFRVIKQQIEAGMITNKNEIIEQLILLHY